MQNANANVPFIKRAGNHQRVVLLTNIERGKSNREISFNGASSVPHVALRIQIATRVRCTGLPGHFLLRGKVFTYIGSCQVCLEWASRGPWPTPKKCFRRVWASIATFGQAQRKKNVKQIACNRRKTCECLSPSDWA